MKQIILIIFLSAFWIKGSCQDFKYLNPKLTDSTEIIKKEIDSENQFERLYYIDNRKNSDLKKNLINFGIKDKASAENLEQIYSEILKNMGTKPKKNESELPEKWVKIFKYKNKWILYDDLPKYILTDSCLVTVPMDDPYPSIINDFEYNDQKYELQLISYNWENPKTNVHERLVIKLVDKKKMIFLWKFVYDNQLTYSLMIPIEQVGNFPIMNFLTTDFMGDEDEIFDKIDYKKYE